MMNDWFHVHLCHQSLISTYKEDGFLIKAQKNPSIHIQ